MMTKVTLWTSSYIRALTADFAAFSGVLMLMPLIPLYAQSLQANETVIGIVAGAFMITAVALRPISGWMIDSYGRKAIFIGSMGLFVLGAAGLPLTDTLPQVICIRMLQGAAWSAMVTATTTLQSDVIPSQRRGEGIGFASSSRNLAMAMGPALGLMFVNQISIASALWLSAAVSVLGFMSALWVRDSYKIPILRPKLKFRNLLERSAIVPSLVSGAMMFVFGGFITFIPLDAQKRTIGDPAIFFLVSSMLLISIRPLVGRWADRLRNRRAVMFAGMISTTASVWLLALVEAQWTLLPVACLWAIGFGVVQPIIRSVVLEGSSRQRWGAANATTLTILDLGMAISTPVLGMVAKYAGFSTMYLVAGIVPLLCMPLLSTRIFNRN